MAERVVAGSGLRGELLGHPGTVVAVEGVALDEHGVEPLATEDLGERP